MNGCTERQVDGKITGPFLKMTAEKKDRSAGSQKRDKTQRAQIEGTGDGNRRPEPRPGSRLADRQQPLRERREHDAAIEGRNEQSQLSDGVRERVRAPAPPQRMGKKRHPEAAPPTPTP